MAKSNPESSNTTNNNVLSHVRSLVALLLSVESVGDLRSQLILFFQTFPLRTAVHTSIFIYFVPGTWYQVPGTYSFVPLLATLLYRSGKGGEEPAM